MKQLPPELVSLAVRGTANVETATTNIATPTIDLNGQYDDFTAEEQLLLFAYAHQLTHLAGHLPKVDAAITTSPAPITNKPFVSNKATFLLFTMLKGHNSNVLPEWIQLAVKHGQSARPESLPHLFALGHKHPRLRSSLLTILGERGTWLARLINRKSSLWVLLDRSSRIWADAKNSAERQELLLLLRKHDPEKFHSIWAEDACTDIDTEVLSYLELLENQLRDEDVSILTPLLNHENSRIRLAAAQHLIAITESDLSQEVSPKIVKALSLRGQGLRIKLHVDREQLSVIQEEYEWLYPSANITELATLLLSALPITVWLTQLNESLPQIWNAAQRSDTKNEPNYIDALVSSIVRSGQTEQRCFALKHLPAGVSENKFTSLVTSVPSSDLEPIIIEQFEMKDRLFDKHPSIRLLLNAQFGWSEALTRKFFQGLHNYLRNASRPSPVMQNLLSHGVLYLNVNDWTWLGKQLEASIGKTKVWDDLVAETRLMLQFRHDLHKAFNSTNNRNSHD